MSHIDLDGQKRVDTPLLEAINRSDIEEFHRLIDAGADIATEGEDGDSPLCRAVAMDARYFVRKLIENGVDIHQLNSRWLTPLHRAAKVADIAPAGFIEDVVRPLINAGASVSFVPDDAPADYLTPFQRAVRWNSVSFVKLCTEELGEDPQQRTIDGRAMLDLAADGSRVKRYLLSLQTAHAINEVMQDGETGGESTPKKPGGASPL